MPDINKAAAHLLVSFLCGLGVLISVIGIGLLIQLATGVPVPDMIMGFVSHLGGWSFALLVPVGSLAMLVTNAANDT